MIRLALGFMIFAGLFATIAGNPGRGTPIQMTSNFEQKPMMSGADEAGEAAGNGVAESQIKRSPDGHFYVDALVNGSSVHFLVDTGASMVALTREDAQRVGLVFFDNEFTGEARTASGTAKVKPVKLERVAVGALEAPQVDAAIIDSGLGISLLGQSWLQRVGNVTITGDTLILR